MLSSIRGFVVVTLIVFNIDTVATPLAVSNTFSPRAIVKEADVNANFRALVDDINLLARSDKLEGFGSIAMADLAGTYTSTTLSTQIYKANAGLSSETDSLGPISATGTITLNANGTATRSDAIWQSKNLTWTLADNIITTSDGESLVIFPGSITIAGTGYNNVAGMNWIILMVKQ